MIKAITVPTITLTSTNKVFNMELRFFCGLALFPTSTLLYMVKEDQVKFYLHTRTSAEIHITANNFTTVDATKTFHFITHGRNANRKRHFVQSLTAAYLEQDDCNVIQVDWRKPAAQSLYVVAVNTKGVGVYVGKFISKLIKELGTNPVNINLVGHSCGSHVSAYAGKQVIQEVGVKVRKITLADPPQRPFESTITSDNDRISSGDAEIVVCIHSDVFLTGSFEPLGTIDFYANGGLDPQPGCEDSIDTHLCSHIIVIYFLIESIRAPTSFTAVKCDSYENYLAGVCDSEERVNLGGNFENTVGVFYFETNAAPPFSKG